ncbi:acyl-CoA dehydrogenase family protein [Streptomyces galbus]|uniref:Acyl-CoA/acyl-ACP dehydrogenase n=1 Tax=Streptomyces galbus TaxID=33898 RepID=A0ABX1IF82_STRGB|nr:acyl-CoA dehydrogenase family protein [Streptomyces galbus]NKQ24074.1 acyl-CoA/acyl-ACP dehydrogenase [Streptomyces galbus]
MTAAPLARETAPHSFLTDLLTGHLDWPRWRGFPRPDRAEQERGDRLVAEAREYFAARVDADGADDTRTLPDGLLDDLRRRGYFRLVVPEELGGLGLTPYTAFRVIAQACAHSVAVGQVVAIQNGVGAAAMLPALPPGPLRDFVGGRLAAGTLSGFGDTDRSGQNNARPTLTATPVDGGYRLRGEKLFTGNGPVADLIGVSATVPGEKGPKVGAFFLDTATPGFSVGSRVEFMGSRGLPNASLVFDDVFVPAGQALLDPDGDQLPPDVGLVALLGRIHFTGAPAMAVARNCLAWSRDFIARRTIDGRPLGAYDEIQRTATATLGQVYAMESAVRWSLLADGLADRWFERFATKNLLVRGAWRIVDRTVSLHGGEGFETAASKRRRGAVPVPLERAFRDARGLRIAGNVDFQLDNQLGRMLLAHFRAAARPDALPRADIRATALAPANQEHLRALADLVRLLHELVAGLLRRHPDPDRMYAEERTVVLLGRIAAELFNAVAVLARAGAADPAEAPDPWEEQELADLYLVEARHRLAGFLARLREESGPDHAKISRRWLAGSHDRLVRH